MDVVKQLEQIGLKVHAIVTDCGGGNKRMWNDLDLHHQKRNVLSNKALSHPNDNTRKLELVPDPVHIFKSIVQGWISNRYILIPTSVLKKFQLSFGFADINHIKELVVYEQECDLRIASGLTLSDVDFGKERVLYDKMKVINSFKFVNHKVCAALRLFAEEMNRNDILTTALFIEYISTWFEFMTSRTTSMALSRGNNYQTRHILRK